jgi:GTP-binding protein
MSRFPSVVIVGRMNVGKSTLFNRLSSSVKSMTLNYHGVTRDLIRDTVNWQGRSFELIDTAGVMAGLRVKAPDELTMKIWEKAWSAVQASDLVMFMGDGTVGVTQEDREIIRQLHRLHKKMIVVVNKSDVHGVEQQLFEFTHLGSEATILLSAEHGKGIDDLLDAILAALPEKKAYEAVESKYKVVILGRPNVGKSSLMNHLVRADRSIVCDMPGTTREAVSQSIVISQEHIMVTDTPGMRRKSTISEELEENMVYSSLQALTDADIVLLVIDGSEGTMVDQDLKLGFYAFTERYKSLIILINKADLIDEDREASLSERCEEYRYLLDKVPHKKISCVTGKNVGMVLPLVEEVWQRSQQKFDTALIYHLFAQELEKRPLMRNGQRLLVHDIRQVGKNSIIFRMTVNESAWFGASQLQFFENILRKKYDLRGVAVKFIVRKK